MAIRSTIRVGQVSLLVLLICASHSAMSQGTFPLAKGNLWQYWDHDFQNGEWFWIYAYTEKVIGDTLMPNGKTYAVVENDFPGSTGQGYLRQEDTRVVSFDPSDSSDYLLYDFSKTVGDTIRTLFISGAEDTFITVISYDGFGTVFGTSVRLWDYYTYSARGSSYYLRKVLADRFGIVHEEWEPGGQVILRGAIIDNVSYGTIVSVEDERPIVPASFQLDQNYPNPFNPSTTIRYGLPGRSHVTLTVFNTLGQQVATLVQGEQEAGYHEVQFDASGFVSGVYLYRLTAGSHVGTKTLVLVR